MDAGGGLRRRSGALERFALAACRLAPHAALTVAVAAQPAAFATTARYCMAVGGLAYINVTNGIKARRAFWGGSAAGAKLKAA